jgi:D-sedoheptulose 7-phosphate isomerase
VNAAVAGADAARLDELLDRRTEANRAFFVAEAERLARLCHLMAERFARGGRLVAFGSSPAARSDARHVAVEFVHPVIVGKRALPALGLAGEGGDLAGQVELLVRPDDIAIAFGIHDAGGEAARALAAARARGCLTIAFSPSEAEWCFDPPSDDPAVRQELVETLYHVLSTIAACSRDATRAACTTRARRASSTRSSASTMTTSRLSWTTSAARRS